MMRIVAALIDRLLNSFAPLPTDRAEQLAQYEAGVEVFEPDELWAASHLQQPATTNSAAPWQAAHTPPLAGGGGPKSRCDCAFDPPLADWEQELHNISHNP